MTLPRWDAAASRAVRCAESMFASADLGWFRTSAVRMADPRSAFDDLIRAALSSGESEPAPAAESLTTAPPPLPLRRPPAPLPRTPDAVAEAAVRSRPTDLLPRLRPWVTPSTPHPAGEQVSHRPAATVLRPRRAAEMRPPASETTRRLPRSSRSTDDVARLSARLAEASVVPMLDPASLASTSAARLFDAPTSSGLDSDLAPALDRVGALPPIHETSTERAPTAGASIEEGPSRSLRQVPAMRLVEGVSALQGLMQAAVAESHARHAATAVDPASAPSTTRPVAPTSPPDVRVHSGAGAPGGLTLRALPVLDDVAEDMLVDRLCDRLQERLRDQALRQFGLTGGLI